MRQAVEDAPLPSMGALPSVTGRVASIARTYVTCSSQRTCPVTLASTRTTAPPHLLLLQLRRVARHDEATAPYALQPPTPLTIPTKQSELRFLATLTTLDGAIVITISRKSQIASQIELARLTIVMRPTTTTET